jgi:hypothetical protein
MNKRSPFLKSAAVYLIHNKVIICPYARTRDGLRYAMEVLAVSNLGDFSDIGQKTVEMLELCKDNLPDDYSHSTVSNNHILLSETQQKTWGTMQKKALLVDVIVEQKPNRVKVSPWQRNGSGYTMLNNKMRFCELDPKAIGEAIILAFADAK